MLTVVIVIHLMIVLALIGVVLLQKSEGGGLGMGGGGAGGFLSSRGTANVLTRATAILAMGFFITSLLLSILAGLDRKPRSIVTPAGGAPAAPAPGGEPPPPGRRRSRSTRCAAASRRPPRPRPARRRSRRCRGPSRTRKGRVSGPSVFAGHVGWGWSVRRRPVARRVQNPAGSEKAWTLASDAVAAPETNG